MSTQRLPLSGQGVIGIQIGPSGKFVYVLDFLDILKEQISVFSFDTNAGTLSPTASAPISIQSGQQILLDPSGHYLFLLSGGTSGSTAAITTFQVDPVTGALTPVSNASAAPGGVPISLAIDPATHFLYAATCEDFAQLGACMSVSPSGLGGDSIWSFPVNTATGQLGIGTHVDSFGVISMVVDPTGQFVYAVGPQFSRQGTIPPPRSTIEGSVSSVEIFSSAPSTGVLSLVDRFPTGQGSDRSIALTDSSRAVSFTAKFIYVSNLNVTGGGTPPHSNEVSGYSFDGATGKITPLGSWPTGGNQAAAVVADPTGHFLYVANQTINSVSGFMIDQTTGTLTSVGPAMPVGSNPLSLASDASLFIPSNFAQPGPGGHTLLVLNHGDNTVQSFTIDGATGQLKPFAGCSPHPTCDVEPTDKNPLSVSINGRIGRVYVAANAAGNGTITVDPGPIANSTAVSGGPGVLLIGPDGKRAYATAQTTVNGIFNEIQVFDLATFPPFSASPIDSTQFHLPFPPANAVFGAKFPTLGNSSAIAVDPRERFVYVANESPPSISRYVVDQTSYLLPQGTTNIVPIPTAAMVDPSGAWLVVVGVSASGPIIGPGTISSFKIDQATGVLTHVSDAPTGINPSGIVITQSIN
jgi:6-phosphogluconolactonase (cycloisomerase 2 family)